MHNFWVRLVTTATLWNIKFLEEGKLPPPSLSQMEHGAPIKNRCVYFPACCIILYCMPCYVMFKRGISFKIKGVFWNGNEKYKNCTVHIGSFFCSFVYGMQHDCVRDYKTIWKLDYILFSQNYDKCTTSSNLDYRDH